jgi:hypothetical protein
VVHLGLSWVEIDSATVKVDSCFEVFTITVSADSAFDSHDLAVHALGHGVLDVVSAVAHHIVQSLLAVLSTTSSSADFFDPTGPREPVSTITLSP